MSLTPLFKHIYADQKKLLMVIFCFSLVVSAIFLWQFRTLGPSQHLEAGGDHIHFYKPIADALLAGEGFIAPANCVTAPGQPLFLVIAFLLSRLLNIPELVMVVVLNAVVIALSAVILYLCVKLIFSKGIAVISALLWASYPLLLWFIKKPNTEVIFIFLFYLSLWFLIQGLMVPSTKKVFWGGVILGAATLVRPITLFLPIVLLGLIFFGKYSKKDKLKIGAALLIGFMLLIGIWQIFINWSSPSFILIECGVTSSVKDGFTFTLRPSDAERLPQVPQDVQYFMEQANRVDFNSKWQVIGFVAKSLWQQPVTFIKFISIKMARSWYATSEMWWETQILLLQIPYLTLAIFGIIVALRKYWQKTFPIWLLLIVIVYFWMFTVVILSIVRYMIPIMALLMPFVAVSLYAIAQKICKFNKHEA